MVMVRTLCHAVYHKHNLVYVLLLRIGTGAVVKMMCMCCCCFGREGGRGGRRGGSTST